MPEKERIGPAIPGPLFRARSEPVPSVLRFPSGHASLPFRSWLAPVGRKVRTYLSVLFPMWSGREVTRASFSRIRS